MKQPMKNFLCLLAAALGLALVEPGRAQVPGGFSAAPTTDAWVQAAAKFAVTARDPQLKLLGVEQAQRQVVAGMNYRLTLKVDDGGTNRIADVVVWRKLDGKHELTSWQWQPTKPKLKIIPGQVIIPTGNGEMRRPWGELISLDLKTRTGKFRNEGDDSVMSFTVMPYAELLHHAASGDLQDFRVGERAIFRLHENEKGEWVWLTYIQDEMNMLNGHKEYFYVDKIDAAKRAMDCTWANFDKSFIRMTNVLIETDGETRFWKAGAPAKFADIKPGDKLRTKTHGAGSGKRRIAWEVFLDDESLMKFQAKQKAVHAARIQKEGAPGYVDALEGKELKLTLFNEGADFAQQLKAGKSVRVAPASADRKPTIAPLAATVTAASTKGRETKVTLVLTSEAKFQPAGLARVWLVE
ncbi:MAG: cystatin domain-containing protein [Limisphaerales bacterium]